MPSEKICKTVRQYNSEPVLEEDMSKLREIAGDCSRVKNYVYGRFGGIGGLPMLYPGYAVQNAMTDSGLRASLGLPSVYFYLAVFDALGDIRSQWTRTKSKLSRLIGCNENLTPEEKHYLRFLLKVGIGFEAVLNQKPVTLPGGLQKKYQELAEDVDVEKLHRYLCRQVRKYHVKLHTDNVSGFSTAERAYRYGDHGIYLSTKQSRSRIFVPLTDGNKYKSQLYIRLYPEESRLEIRVPVEISVTPHNDYLGEVGISMGMFTMLTTQEGHCYGEELGELQTSYSEWMRSQTASYRRNRQANPGRKKYQAKKNRLTQRLHSYINQEINRFFREEKPGRIYMVKLPEPQRGGAIPMINNNVSLWHRGYIRKRLEQKCREQSVELVWVWGKNIGRECSECGGIGTKNAGMFSCQSCGYTAAEKINTARNVWKRGRETVSH